METLLSVGEVARRLGGISKSTVRAWLTSGRLKRTKVGGRTMVRESELEKVVQDGGKSMVGRSLGSGRNSQSSLEVPAVNRGNE